MTKSYGYAALEKKAALVPLSFERRDAGAHDVTMEILYCGICHTDLCYVDDDWGASRYPLVPGHEIVGRITAVGDQVSKFKIGDMAAIGCLVDSCRQCDPCLHQHENMCAAGPTPTYSGLEREGGRVTFGGYSNNYVADEAYVLKVPETMDPAGTAPLLCAGITTYSPLRHWNVGPGKRVGIVGIGGLGHVAIKIAKALGAEVIALTTSPGKIADAKALGADKVVISRDPAMMEEEAGRLDFILDTVSANHDLDALLALLRADGTLCLVGVSADPMAFNAFSLIRGRKSLVGSPAGGLAETQEMLDFCAEHGIHADVEVIGITDVNAAYKRLHRNDVKYRFVIDMATLVPDA